MSAAAGWYADPSGAVGQLRWWDGTRWTDHVTPDPSVVQPAGAPVAADTAAEGATPPPPLGVPGAGWGGQAPVPAWQVDTPVPSRSSGVRTGLIVAAIVGVLVLVLLTAIGFVLMRGGTSTFTELTDEWDVPFGEEWTWDGETVALGVVGGGEEVRGQVPSDGGAEATLEVTDAGTYTIDVRGQGDFDAMVAVFGPDGDLLDENDDRGFDAPNSTNDLDPYLELDLGPGEHRVVVRGWAGDGGAFVLAVEER